MYSDDNEYSSQSEPKEWDEWYYRDLRSREQDRNAYAPFVVGFVILSILAFLLGGCSIRPKLPAPPEIPGIEAGVDLTIPEDASPSERVKLLDQQIAKIRGALAARTAERDAARQEAQEAAHRAWRTWCWVVAAILGVLGAAATGLLIYLGATKLAMLIGVPALGGAVGLVLVGEAIRWAPIALPIVAVVVVGGIVWAIVRRVRTLNKAVAVTAVHAARMESLASPHSPRLVSEAKTRAAGEQVRAGLHTIIDKLRDRAAEDSAAREPYHA